ncbi:MULTISPECIES: DEAD/DEAH box helicase family protein [Bacillus cereus group]|uniref:restriction endonuclease n=1 Tax=Bacillus cereus group TaxID=86661 RepID=UPI000BF42469|nr:DEAD/DEAH box helicase family protein [Bacillus cereus]PFC54124.1 restriction endonuclease subunit R [Bacillus cereus]PFO04047.1 restriction endonuclease subunit R [Bacillus cereus]PGU54368.1 restriction endonuclease subunit R [Bacillus cereus]
MKIQFDELSYQQDAINSVIRVFEGHQIRQSNFTISDNDLQGKFFGDKGVGNRIIQQPHKMLENVQQIQIDSGIPISEHISAPFPQFNIEMETGTGKTFVYLKSILELNRSYGFTKFVIVVPSVAIKEGVIKTLEMTKDYFKTQMNGIIYRSFMYDSSRLNEVRDFAQSEEVEIMVINIQAFSKGKKNTDNMNIIYRKDMDALYGIAPIELISETNPIVIIDEPQSVDNTENAKNAIAALNPSVAFRYSATHKNTDYPLLYKLGPVEAYQNELVKQIEVAGIKNNMDGNEAYIKLLNVKAQKNSITATVEMYVKSKNNIEKKEVKLKQDDDLYIKSKRISSYERVGFVQGISAEPGNEYIEFSGEPSMIRLSETIENDRQIKRGQIRKTIEEHLNKELKLNPMGVKVLSLFFVDNVANYRQYDQDNNPLKGEYARIFEEEYMNLIKKDKYCSLRDKSVPVTEVHDGYFAQDTKGKVKNTNGDSQADESTYQIIMKDKEDLLTFYDQEKGSVKKANKLRFIFSHSALKEGWDNPNVFQICTLIESKDTITKRQKIGRGLRIAVNQEGERISGFEVNTLTVMANESYQDFASGLQKEYEEEGVQFGVFDEGIFSALIIDVDEHTGFKTPLGRQKSKELVQFLKDSKYLDTKNKGTEALAKAIKEGTFEIPEEIAALAEDMEEKVIEVIQQKFDSNKVEIKDRDERIIVKVKKEALAGPFLELWEKIKYKTNYSINFDSEQFSKSTAEKLSDELEIRIAKLEYMKANLANEESGISVVNQSVTGFEASEHEYNQVPDVLAYLQNETKLTRKTLITILKESDTLRDFKRNPQMYMMETARIINSAKRLTMIDGIKYEKNNEFYDQQLFVAEELVSYKDNTVEVKDDRSPYDHIIVDSQVERDFANECEQDDNVKFYIKLPSWFKVKTPLGPYNPDWAILLEKFGEEKLYFVVETKGSTLSDDLRPTELAKIKCGKKHFKAIDTGVIFKKEISERNIY